MTKRSLILSLLLLVMISAFAVPAGGEVITVRKEVRQLLGSAMSQNDARIVAIAREGLGIMAGLWWDLGENSGSLPTRR